MIRKMNGTELKTLRIAYSVDDYLLDGAEMEYQRTPTQALIDAEGMDAVKEIIEFVLNDPEQRIFVPAHEARRHGEAYITDDVWILKRFCAKYKKTACVKVWHLYSSEHLTIGVCFED